MHPYDLILLLQVSRLALPQSLKICTGLFTHHLFLRLERLDFLFEHLLLMLKISFLILQLFNLLLLFRRPFELLLLGGRKRPLNKMIGGYFFEEIGDLGCALLVQALRLVRVLLDLTGLAKLA